MKHKVLTYGSLRRGMGNHPLIEDQDYIGEQLVGGFRMASLGAFPALVPSEEGCVLAELYEVDDDGMATLDMLEGYPSFYDRKQVDGAWIYFIDSPELLEDEVPYDEDGVQDWVKFKTRAA